MSEDKKAKQAQPVEKQEITASASFAERFRAYASARKPRILSLVLISLALPLIVCVSVPFDIFAHNTDEFVFSLSDFLPWCILFGLAVAVLIAAVLFVLPHKAYKIVAYVFVAIEFLFFLQGTYLNAGLSSLAGDDGGWVGGGTNAKTVTFIILNAVVWACLIAAMVVLSLRPDKKGYIRMASIIMVVIVLATQLMNVAVLSISDREVFMSYAAKEERDGKFHSCTSTDFGVMAEDANVYYFLVDRFDYEYALKCYEKNPEIFESLEDFTWFTDNVSLYPHTYPSIAYMLTDNMHDAEKYREEFLSTVYEGETPLKELHDAGYNVRLYTQPYYVYNYNGVSLPDYVDNFITGSYVTERRTELVFRMLQMSLYRCFPSALKRVIGGMNSYTCNNCISFYGDDGSPFYSSDNRDVWYLANETEFTLRGGKNFSFVHMEGCHDVLYNDEWKKANAKEKKDVTYCVRGCFKTINVFLDELKAKGLYDDATIIITGDHCRSVSNKSNISDSCKTALFVKRRKNRGGGSDKRETLRISNAQVCHGDLWPTIMKSEGIESAYAEREGVFDIAEDEARERPYIHQTYHRGQLDEYYYTIKGDADDFDNWYLDESKTKHYNHHIMD